MTVRLLRLELPDTVGPMIAAICKILMVQEGIGHELSQK